jgi:tRNA-Thr(GGU) m(6)t(6)A37 methyltransferase TsaA
MLINIQAIGIIHTDHTSKEQAPIQGVFHPDAIGTVELFPEFAEGLLDIELFSHLYLFYHFDRAEPGELIRRPFLDDTPHGIFATRHPCRPNGIGITVVRLLERNGNKLTVKGIDVLDGTPLLDVKPYVPRFDCHPEASEGWFTGKSNRQKPSGRE